MTLVLLVAGCHEPAGAPQEPVVGPGLERPPTPVTDLYEGPGLDPEQPFVAVFGGLFHSGSGGIQLVPNGTAELPASCLALRDERLDPADRCRIQAGRPSHADFNVTWHVRGDWNGTDERPGATFEVMGAWRVEVFDSAGAPLGVWWGGEEGAYHPAFYMFLE